MNLETLRPSQRTVPASSEIRPHQAPERSGPATVEDDGGATSPLSPPGDPPRLSIILPAYNEEATIGHILRSVLGLPISLQLVVVDDGSFDHTRTIVERIASTDPRVLLISHARNRGKGAAIRTALPHATGDITVIQDGDLEYDPTELLPMLDAFAEPTVSVVYGSRWLATRWSQRFSRSYIAAAALSWLTNRLFGSSLTDEPTCYKMFRTSLLRTLSLAAAGFDFCPEVTAKVLLAGYSIREVPISYKPRSYAEGKKIRLSDAAPAVCTLLRLRFHLGANTRPALTEHAR